MDKYLGVNKETVDKLLNSGKPEDLKYIAMGYYPYVLQKARELGKTKEEIEELSQIGMVRVMETITFHSAKDKHNITNLVINHVNTALNNYVKVRCKYYFVELQNLDELVDDKEKLKEIYFLIDNLNAEEKYIFCSYFGINDYEVKSKKELAQELNFSSIHIGVILRQIVRQMQEYFDARSR